MSQKIAVTITCENPDIRSIIEKSIQNALLSQYSVPFHRSLGVFKIVRDESWDYLLRYTVIEKDSPFVEIHVEYNWNRHITHEAPHSTNIESTNIEIGQAQVGVYQERLGELSEFCRYQVQMFAKWRNRWGPESQEGV